jgi:hypothetical protein
MTPRQRTCQESSSVRRGTAVIRRTPSPLVIIRSTEWKSIAGFYEQCFKSRVSGEQETNQAEVAPVVWKAQCACKSGMKKSDCGKARSDTRARGTTGRPRKACPCRARSKYAEYPDCRTCRSERTRHNRAEWPTRRSASRKLYISMAAALRRRRNNPSRCAAEIAWDYRSDKRDIASSDSPGILRQG